MTAELNRLFQKYFNERELAEADVWRIQNSWYGLKQYPFAPRGHLLLIGGRSGIEAKWALTRNPNTYISILEEDARRREALKRILPRSVKFFGSIHHFIDKNGSQPIDHVRVELNETSEETITLLLRSAKVTHICGELSKHAINVVQFSALCRAKCQSFYFRLQEGGALVSPSRKFQKPVSVVVPVYNVEKFVDECLDSLSRQTLDNIEVLIVNDGSTNSSRELCLKWASKHSDRMRLIDKPNGGCASSRMAGLTEACGEYVGFVDADDRVEPQMYEELYAAALCQSADMAQCGYDEFFTDGSRILRPSAHGGDGAFGLSGTVRQPAKLWPFRPAIWRRIYRKEFLLSQKVEFPIHIRRFDDLPFEFLATDRAEKLAMIPDCYYGYRQGRLSQDVNVKDERLFIHFEIFDWLFRTIKPHANRRTWRKFHQVRRATHRWALSRIERRLWLKYKLAVLRERFRFNAAMKMY